MIHFQFWGEFSVLAGEESRREAVVIDPGNHFEPISKFIIDGKWTLLAVLLTHGDLLHAARAWDLAAKFQAPVIAHESILSALQRLPAEGEKEGLCGVKSPQLGRFLHHGDRLKLGPIEVDVAQSESKGKPQVIYTIGDRRFDGGSINR